MLRLGIKEKHMYPVGQSMQLNGKYARNVIARSTSSLASCRTSSGTRLACLCVRHFGTFRVFSGLTYIIMENCSQWLSLANNYFTSEMGTTSLQGTKTISPKVSLFRGSNILLQSQLLHTTVGERWRCTTGRLPPGGGGGWGGRCMRTTSCLHACAHR